MNKLILHSLRLFLLTLALCTLPGIARADDLDGRSAFLGAPGRDVAEAMKKAGEIDKRVLVFVVNPAKHEGKHIVGTMGVAETKSLVRDNFIVVIVTNPHEKHVAGLVDDVVSVHPAYILFKPDGTVVDKGDAAMGAANGLNWAKKLVAMP